MTSRLPGSHLCCLAKPLDPLVVASMLIRQYGGAANQKGLEMLLSYKATEPFRRGHSAAPQHTPVHESSSEGLVSF